MDRVKIPQRQITRFERETHEAGRIEAAALEPAARLEFGVADARHTDPRG
jgi:hypothetical protein